MTPFLLTVSPPARWLPPFPGVHRVPETNLRTYVRDRKGRHGIWFFSCDVEREEPDPMAPFSVADVGSQVSFRHAMDPREGRQPARRWTDRQQKRRHPNPGLDRKSGVEGKSGPPG